MWPQFLLELFMVNFLFKAPSYKGQNFKAPVFASGPPQQVFVNGPKVNTYM